MATIYPSLNFAKDLGQGNLVLTSNLKALILTDSYVPNFGTHTRRSHLTNEVTGTNYTAGGISISAMTFAEDTTNLRNIFTLPSFTFTNITVVNMRFIWVYRSTGTASNDPLIWLFRFAGVEARSAADLTMGVSTLTIQNPAYP